MKLVHFVLSTIHNKKVHFHFLSILILGHNFKPHEFMSGSNVAIKSSGTCPIVPPLHTWCSTSITHMVLLLYCIVQNF